MLISLYLTGENRPIPATEHPLITDCKLAYCRHDLY